MGKGNFSKEPLAELMDNLGKGYIGIRVEQGVPVLDRDLNLLSEMIAETIRRTLRRHIGDGTADRSDAFLVSALPAADDFAFAVGGGRFLVGGLEVVIEPPPAPATTWTYKTQPHFASASLPGLTPIGSGTREDTVYLDAWIEEVDKSDDAGLENVDDVGVQTSVRLRAAWAVRVHGDSEEVPAAPDGHHHARLATLARRAGASPQVENVEDGRRTQLSLSDLEERVRTLENRLAGPVFDPTNEISPNLIAIGAEVTLHGENFDLAIVAIQFVQGGTVVSANLGTVTTHTFDTIRVRVPAGTPVGQVTVRLTTAAGTAESTELLTVFDSGGPVPDPDPDPPGPVDFDPVDAVSPGSGIPGTVVTLRANSASSNRFGATPGRVLVDGLAEVPSATLNWSQQQITFPMPNLAAPQYASLGLNTAFHPATLVVETQDGRSGSAPETFGYLPAP